jgi:hypothetical protein
VGIDIRPMSIQKAERPLEDGAYKKCLDVLQMINYDLDNIFDDKVAR